ncbi:MAG: hypothetical protein PHI97_20145 [Desulfobulbus sp.]|nr:hypothetical protein [Desulfobulbus sp.]
MPAALFRQPAVLVIEDELTQRQMLLSQLTSQGYKLMVGGGGQGYSHSGKELILTLWC